MGLYGVLRMGRDFAPEQRKLSFWYGVFHSYLRLASPSELAQFNCSAIIEHHSYARRDISPSHICCRLVHLAICLPICCLPLKCSPDSQNLKPAQSNSATPVASHELSTGRLLSRGRQRSKKAFNGHLSFPADLLPLENHHAQRS